MRIVLLGPVRVFADDGSPVEVGGARLRMLLARLAVDAGQFVAADALIDGLWGENPPADAVNALQALVSRLRKALREVGLVDSVAGGYRLPVSPADVDAHQFEEQAKRGRRDLGAGRVQEASSVLGAALGLWQGAAFADLPDAPFAKVSVARWDELRTGAAEDRFDAELRLGRHAEILADLEELAARHPLRERLAGLRMRALYAAGRQSDALTVYETTRTTLAEELGVDPSPKLRDTHLAVLRGELEPVVAEADPGRLPARLTSFVGREDELKLLAELMVTSRLVTIVGPGGAGKTRLAVEAASRHQTYQRGQVWFVPLAGVRDGIADAVLGALHYWDIRLPQGRTGRQPVDRVVELLDVGEAVLVLDNCEHLVAAVADFAHQVLERLPGLRIVATSRESLGINGESLHQLGPLDVPAATPELDAAAESPAVQLFVDRAVAVRPGFTLDESTVEPVVDICRRLDGLPLAIELAAARLRSMTAGQIAQRLDDRFRLLTAGNRTALPRHRTLLAVVEWSWDLLTEQERVLARRLSVFPGGATGIALEEVCADELLPAKDTIYVLGSLVEKSIVEATGEGEPRYRMLETIRAYAAERLDQAGERDAVIARFVPYFVAQAEENEQLMLGRHQLAAIAYFDTESGNLVAALRTAIDTGAVDLAARLLGPMYWYWNLRQSDSQAETYVADVLRFGDALPAHTHAAFTALQLLTSNAGPGMDGDGVRSVVDDCVRTGAIDQYPVLVMVVLPTTYFWGLDDLWDRELRRAKEHPQQWVRTCGLWVESYVRVDRGDWHGGAKVRAEALQAFEELGEYLGRAMALIAMANTYSVQGESAKAVAAYERSVALTTEFGSLEEIWPRTRLVLERMRGGDLAGAMRDLEIARHRARDRGRQSTIEVLLCAAELYRRSGRLDEAGETLDQLTVLTEEMPAAEAWMTGCRVAPIRMSILLGTGAVEPARVLLPEVVSGAVAVRDVASAAELLARLRFAEGDPADAAMALGMSEVIRGAFDEGNPELRELVAELVRLLGEADYAEAYRRGAGLLRDDAMNRLITESGPA